MIGQAGSVTSAAKVKSLQDRPPLEQGFELAVPLRTTRSAGQALYLHRPRLTR